MGELPLDPGGGLDVPALRRRIQAFGELAGVVTLFEPAVGRALEAQRALGLPEISRLDARALRNKAAMVETMERAGLRAPQSVYGREAAELVATADRTLAYPMIGAAGVRMVTVPHGGKVRSIRPPLLRHDREIAAFEVGPGDPVHSPKPGGVTRVGYVIVAADDPDFVERRLDQLVSEVEVELD